MTADPWTYSQPVAAHVPDGTRGESAYDKAAGPKTDRPGDASTTRVAAPGDTERARTLWRLDRKRYRRRVGYALDEHLIRMYGAEAAAEYGIRDRRRWWSE